MNSKDCFRITMAAIAITGATVLSSCSHDDYYYNEEKAEQSVNEQYAIAFEKAFGKVGPNVDWGFSSKNTNARAFTRAGGVTFNTTIIFPSDYTGSFAPDLTDVPSYNDYCKTLPNATQWNIPTEFGYGVVYIDKAQNIHINGGTEAQRSRLYLKRGTYDFKNYEFYLGKYVDLFLLEGATLTLDNLVATNAIFDIYIAPGAELIANGENGLIANSGLHIYNHGTITCSKFEANSTSVLYNSGTLDVTGGTVSAESDSSKGEQSFIVNNGTIECANVIVNAGAVLNIVEWTVSNTTEINSPNSGWINNGQWTTYNFAYVAGSENVINNCYLKVNNDFDMNVSSLSALGNKAFKINSGGSVETENFYGGRNLANNKVEGGPFRINMAEYSLFKVNNKATLESGRGPMSENEVGFGFFGPSSTSTDGYAVFQAKKIVRDPTLESQRNHGAVTYGGKLYVSAETHFAQGDDGSRPFIYVQDGFSIENNIYASGFNSGKPSINIPSTPCSPGFKGGDPLYRVIAEDLSADQAGDFDFNDVVFDVVKYENGKTTLRLQACGGTLPLKIGSTKGNGGVEVHSLYGENAPDATTGLYHMWNTSPSLSQHDPVDFTIDGQYTTPEQIFNLRIEVFKEGSWMLLTATKGLAACKILVDDRFPIVPERYSIADKFGNFTTYVQGDWNDNDDFWWVQK